jgi:hypothetical protein
MDSQGAASASNGNRKTEDSHNFLEKIKKLPLKHKIFAASGAVLALGSVAFLIFILQNKDSGVNMVPGGKTSDSATPKTVPVPENAIAKVGEVELANYPGEKNEATKKILTDKLVRDSVALQAAKKENLINLNLDSEIFNADNKNYGKRITDIKNIETKINTGMDQISGTLVSVWFHNMVPARIGLEKGKEEALKRISALHRRVVNKEITIEQAGNIIKNDSSYADLDIGYVNNALVPFTFGKGKMITTDARFDAILWNTGPGAVTEVFLAKNKNGFTQQEEDGYYIFGQVKEKRDKGSAQDFRQWLDEKTKEYEVVYY